MKVELKAERVRSALLAKRIRTIRQSIGMRPEVLAALIGVSRPTLLQWENGRCEPSLCVIEKLAETLGTSPEFLTFGPGIWTHEAVKFNVGADHLARLQSPVRDCSGAPPEQPHRADYRAIEREAQIDCE
jgi:transcriptional regulator with XRE-family HTH domain